MFAEEFAFELPAVVNFVGGGGKTALILRLLEEYSASVAAIYTTTTRMHPPAPWGGMVVLSCDNMARLLEVLNCLGRRGDERLRKFVVTGLGGRPDLRQGVSPDFALGIDRECFPLVLNEADGARSMSLKMPREGEPVLMSASNVLVPVIGIDCLNQPLGPETLFRWEMAARDYAFEAGRIVTPELAAAILLHPSGVCKDWRPGMRIMPYINKVDDEKLDPLAHELAQALLHNGNFPVAHVIWGSLRCGRARSVVPGIQ